MHFAYFLLLLCGLSHARVDKCSCQCFDNKGGTTDIPISFDHTCSACTVEACFSAGVPCAFGAKCAETWLGGAGEFLAVAIPIVVVATAVLGCWFGRCCCFAWRKGTLTKPLLSTTAEPSAVPIAEPHNTPYSA